MTNDTKGWAPELDPTAGPKYLQIVRALSDDVQSGALSVGERLPTHRDLAWRLGVTVGTVSRAYAEAERRGLVVGEVGRGSYVRSGARSAASVEMPYPAAPGLIEMGVNEPPAFLGTDICRTLLRDLSRDGHLDELLYYQESRGRWQHRQAARLWLADRGLECDESRILITCGAEHGISSALAGLTNSGDAVVVDELTWPGTQALCGLFGLDVTGVQGDESGMLPDLMERACVSTGAKIVYLIPTAHNPLATTIPEERRRQIAEIARRLDILILEDDIYGNLIPDAPPPIATFAPERTVYITSMSKCVSPTARTGFCVVPDHCLPRLLSAARALNWMAPPLDVEMMCRAIESGAAAEIRDTIVEEMKARHEVVHTAMKGLTYRHQGSALHIWLRLPDQWRPDQVVSLARRAGVSLSPTDIFTASGCPVPQAIRICIGGVRSREILADGLHRVAQLISGPPITELNVA